MLNFIKREKIYILMLLFVLAINIMNFGRAEKAQYKEKPISTMSFEEIGVTEAKVKDFLESGKRSARFFEYAIILGFFVFIFAIVLNLNFIFRRKKIDFKRFPSERPVSWGILDLIRAGILIVFIGYVIGIAEAFIFKFFNLDIRLNLRMIIDTFFIDIAVAMVILYFVLAKYRAGLDALGIRTSSFFRNILSGIMAYIFILPFLLAILFISMRVLDLLGYSPPPQPVFEVFMEEKNSKVLFFLTIFVSILGPLVEEMFFRGFMYGAIKKRFGIICATFLRAAVFSLLHTNIIGFLPIMTLGILLAYIYEKTGSLVAPLAVHITHNSIIVCFVFFMKELIR